MAFFCTRGTQRVISVRIGMHINTFWIALSSACDTRHVAAALQEYCISFHCLLVNQDFPLHATLERRRLSVCCLTDLPSEVWKNNPLQLNLNHYLVVFAKVAKSSSDQGKGLEMLPGVIEWSAKIWWAQTVQWFATKFREIFFSTPDTEPKGG